MRNLNSIVTSTLANPEKFATSHEPGTKSIDTESAQVIESLFNQLKSIFPAWRHAWPDKRHEDNAKRTWTKAFIAARLSSINQIRYGIEKCRKSGSPFMPSIGQFIQWCHLSAEDLGLPSTDRAYLMACAVSHPAADSSELPAAVYHAACEAGMYLLASQPESKSRPVFERAYQLTIQMAASGEPLRDIPKALPSTPTLPKNLPAGNAALAALKRKTKRITV